MHATSSLGKKAGLNYRNYILSKAKIQTFFRIAQSPDPPRAWEEAAAILETLLQAVQSEEGNR
jgi:hypothetical protein